MATALLETHMLVGCALPKLNVQEVRAAGLGDSPLLLARGGRGLRVSHSISSRGSRAGAGASPIRSSRRLRAAPRCSGSQGVQTVEKIGGEGTGGESAFPKANGSGIPDVGVVGEEAPSTEEGSSFNWLTQWYPVGVVKHMDKKVPHAVTVLGRELVLWWDKGSGEWQAFGDACPHRKAPLSEGRVNEEGMLECAYHGWSFGGSGACTRIPQLDPANTKARESKRACATVYPSKSHQGLLFVYMDSSEGAKEQALANPPPTVPELDDPAFVYDLGMSDLGYSYDTLLENLVDPSHVNFVHHGILGRRENAKPLDLRVHEVNEKGFTGGWGAMTPPRYFTAPTLSVSIFTLPPMPSKGKPLAMKLLEFVEKLKKPEPGDESRQVGTIFYCTPMTPSTSRLCYANIQTIAKTAWRLIPRWIAHQKEMSVLDTDSYLLNRMEAFIDDEGGTANTEKIYYTPAASDAFVNGFRKWMKKFGGGGPDYGPRSTDKLPPRESRVALEDRGWVHVDKCTYCSGAKRNFQKLESALQVLPLVLLGLVAASGKAPVPSLGVFSIPVICLAVASYLASKWLNKWIKKRFEYYGWNYAIDTQ